MSYRKTRKRLVWHYWYDRELLIGRGDISLDILTILLHLLFLIISV